MHLFQISNYSVNGLTCIESHEMCPMIMVGTCHGCVIILDLTEPSNIFVLAKYHLTSITITHLKLIPNSNYLIAIDDENYHFVIKRERNSTTGVDDGIKKIMSLPSGYRDYTATKMNDGSLYLLMLFVVNHQMGMNSMNDSECFTEYVRIQTSANYCHQIQTIRVNVSYDAMQFQYYDSNRFVLASKSAEIHLLELIPCELGKIEVNSIQTITTQHSVDCSMKIAVSSASFLTYADDGQCSLWDKNSLRNVTSILAHNKCQRGIKDAILDSMQR